MGIEIWQFWIIIGILLFIVEVFKPTFFAASVAIGCFTAAFFSYLKYDVNIQLVSFSIGTILTFFFIRPLMMKYGHTKSTAVKTNVDALVGKTGKVIIKIDNSKHQGRILVEGDDWKAESLNNTIFNEGEKVEIVKVNSTTLIVKSP